MCVERLRTAMSFRSLGTLFALSLILLAGCAPRTAVVPDRIDLDSHASGNNQAAFHGATIHSPLRVIVEGSQERGLLGGKGRRRPAAGALVRWQIMNPESGAVFVPSGESSMESRADVSGTSQARVQLGARSGDVNISATVETAKGPESVEFRVISGAERVGYNLESTTGGVVPEFGIRLRNPDGSPASGVPVYFRAEGNEDDEDDASIEGEQVVKRLTDETGAALASWKLGDRVQRYFATVEIRDSRQEIRQEDRFQARAIQFEAMATNKTAMLIEMIGGLAIFIFGMRLMSGGLQRMADRRLKAVLQAMTRNRFLATGVGAGLTAMVQSSSATTVMTVGFVNAGLMTLPQAIGVIYGANIGTTVTAQIIAFKLDQLAYPAIAAGLLIAALSRRPISRALGEAILGFGLLFLGLTTMSGVLEPLRYSPEFQSLFQLFDCSPLTAGGPVQAMPAIMCIAIGTFATIAVQSSSATIGLVLALSSQGLLSFYTAVPLVLGDNIGTTITAILASFGTNRNAKRTALAHCLFNIIGSIYMYILMFLPLWNGQPIFLGFIDWITPGEVFSPRPENLPRHVANAHTAFNLFNCLLFLPFVGQMARLTQWLIPVINIDQEQVPRYLEPHLLTTPSIALQQAVKEVDYMLRRAQKSINEACEFFFGGNDELEKSILKREDLIDQLQHEITSYLVELSTKETLEKSEAKILPMLVHAVNDAERIGDHSENLVELTHLRRDQNLVLTEYALEDIRKLSELLNQQFEATHLIFVNQDAKLVERVLEIEEQITQLMIESEGAHVHRLEQGLCDMRAGVNFLDFMAHLERVGDHLTNIAERAAAIVELTRA
ncbi:MAG: Na/Pi cotransporter family protein [Candidatus Hydrogenedentes bacterium]|nr:Na/Pi cotransporter family protein [Candidatus Hydrogenedentota bacterium]